MAKKTEKASEMKTLMDCTSTEFLVQANLIKSDVEEFIKITKIPEIRRQRIQLTGKETDEEKAAAEKQHVERIWNDIFKATFIENPKMTIDIIAKMCFTTAEEIEKLSPTEITNLAILLLGNQRINDFFSALSVWGLFGSVN